MICWQKKEKALQGSREYPLQREVRSDLPDEHRSLDCPGGARLEHVLGGIIGAVSVVTANVAFLSDAAQV